MLAAILAFAAASAKTIKVAFYGLDERVQNAVKTEIVNMNLRRVRYYALKPEDGLPKNFNKKYSLLVMENCLLAKMNEDKFISVKEEIFESLPTSIRKAAARETEEGHYALPLLLDHFELSYFWPAKNKLGLKEPQSYGSLLL